MNKELDKINKIKNLREVWPHEALDFTKWLALEENLNLLSDELGIEIVLEEIESSVGGFNVDIYASEGNSSRKIIIENQLEKTDHDHLGKIITYASGKNAEIIIWIVKEVRDEHKQAIEWLNQHTDENIGFFLIELELWKIGDSKPAVKFNIIESPNNWSKIIKPNNGLSSTKQLQYQFWEEFVDYAFNYPLFSNEFNKRKISSKNYYDLPCPKKPYTLVVTIDSNKNTINCALYIGNNKDVYYHFYNHQDEIENELKKQLIYIESKKDCRIYTSNEGFLKNKEEWKLYYDWFIETSLNMKEIFDKYEL